MSDKLAETSAGTFAVYALVAALACFAGAAIATYARGRLSSASSSLEGPLSFDTESRKLTRALGCRDVKTMSPAYSGGGRLFGCIMGRAETAKFFINEDGERPGTVSDLKVMWNNWQRDLGYGVHADRPEAIKMVRAFAQLYAPSIEEELVAVFQGLRDATIQQGNTGSHFAGNAVPT